MSCSSQWQPRTVRQRISRGGLLARSIRKHRTQEHLKSLCLRAALLGVVLFAVGMLTQPLTSAAGAKSQAVRAQAQEIASGKELFHQHCAPCHFEESGAQKIGPGLKGLYGRTFSNGTKVTDAGLARWIAS